MNLSIFPLFKNSSNLLHVENAKEDYVEDCGGSMQIDGEDTSS